MRDQLLDLLQRLVSIERELGRDAFEAACKDARIAIARRVLLSVEMRAYARKQLINMELTTDRRQTVDLPRND